MGAYHSVNFFLKHPDVFEGTIALSGLYRLDRTEFGLTPADMHAVYFNSPVNYLSGISDAWYLDQYRRSKIIVCVGQGAWEGEAVADREGLAVDRPRLQAGAGAARSTVLDVGASPRRTL